MQHVDPYAVAVVIAVIAIVGVLYSVRCYHASARRFARRYPGVNPHDPEGCRDAFRQRRVQYVTDVEAKRTSEEDAWEAYVEAKKARARAETDLSLDDKFARRHSLAAT